MAYQQRPKKIPAQVSQLRFSVPKDDVEVLMWVQRQNNLSASLRTLVKNFVSKYGCIDCTCLPQSVQFERTEPVQVVSLQQAAPVVAQAPVQSVAQPASMKPPPETRELTLPPSKSAKKTENASGDKNQADVLAEMMK